MRQTAMVGVFLQWRRAENTARGAAARAAWMCRHGGRGRWRWQHVRRLIGVMVRRVYDGEDTHARTHTDYRCICTHGWENTHPPHNRAGRRDAGRGAGARGGTWTLYMAFAFTRRLCGWPNGWLHCTRLMP